MAAPIRKLVQCFRASKCVTGVDFVNTADFGKNRTLFTLARLPTILNGTHNLGLGSQRCFIAQTSCAGYHHTGALRRVSLKPRIPVQSTTVISTSARQFKSDARDENGHDPRDTEIPAWLIKLSNENGYLSWCRNTYILTVAAATIYSQDTFASSHSVGSLLILIGGANLLCGTSSYVHNLWRLRKRNMIHKYTIFPLAGLAILHAFLWWVAMLVYFDRLVFVLEEDKFDDENGGSDDEW